MTVEKKELFNVTWKNIAPPYPEYEYFRDCEQFPFRFDARSYDPVNAWWLIEAATLSYAERDFAEARFRKAGFTEVRYISVKNTQCYVASNQNFIVVAFRGTESRRREGQEDFREIIDDIKTDADIRLVDSGGKGRVHRGFSEGLGHVWGQVNQCVSEISKGKTLWITGHSLGAALATLAAYRFHTGVHGLYVFGSPRAGDREFGSDFDIPAYRFENNNDIVCKVPPEGVYQHVGEVRYIDSGGHIHDDWKKWERRIDEMKGSVENTLQSLGRLGRGAGVIPDALKDHVPVLYAIHIWNNLVNG